MASASLPKPGTEYGPCAEPTCGHTDCVITRQMAADSCHICGKPIGYEKKFYREGLTVSHAACAEDPIYSLVKNFRR